MTAKSSSSGTKKRKKRRPVRWLVLLLLAVLVWMYFDGRLPRFGDEVGEGSGSKNESPRITKTALQDGSTRRGVVGDGGGRAAPVVSDAELGRRRRLDYLIEQGKGDVAALEDAVALARSMRDTATNDDGREYAELALASPRMANAAHAAFEESVRSTDVAQAERVAKLLIELDLADTSDHTRGIEMKLAAPSEQSKSLRVLHDALRSTLPLDLGEQRLERIENGAFVMRVIGTAGGFRFHRVFPSDVDVRGMRKVLVERLAENRREAVLAALAAVLERYARPLAARYVRSGELGVGN